MEKICLGGQSSATGIVIYDADNGIIIWSKEFFVALLNKTTKYPVDQLKEWHATEHKLIWLLENGQKLTLENLKKASIKTSDCDLQNRYLREPSNEKLKEALRMGLKYRRLLKARSSPFFFEPINNTTRKDLVALKSLSVGKSPPPLVVVGGRE